METEVFKVQRPMGTGLVIFYNKDMSVYTEMEMTPELRELMSGKYKIYVRGYIDRKGTLRILERLDNQLW